MQLFVWVPCVPLALARKNTRSSDGGVIGLMWRNPPTVVRNTEQKPDVRSKCMIREMSKAGGNSAEAGIDELWIMDVGRWKEGGRGF